MEIKGLEKLGEVDEAGAAELAGVRAAEEERTQWLLRTGVHMFQVIMARGGNVPGRHNKGGKKKHRAKVAAARKANRERRG